MENSKILDNLVSESKSGESGLLKKIDRNTVTRVCPKCGKRYSDSSSFRMPMPCPYCEPMENILYLKSKHKESDYTSTPSINSKKKIKRLRSISNVSNVGLVDVLNKNYELSKDDIVSITYDGKYYVAFIWVEEFVDA